MLSSHNLAKNLTPTLLKTRKRFETLSAGSTTTDTEGGISPLWEREEVSDINLRDFRHRQMMFIISNSGLLYYDISVDKKDEMSYETSVLAHFIPCS